MLNDLEPRRHHRLYTDARDAARTLTVAGYIYVVVERASGVEYPYQVKPLFNVKQNERIVFNPATDNS